MTTNASIAITVTPTNTTRAAIRTEHACKKKMDCSESQKTSHFCHLIDKGVIDSLLGIFVTLLKWSKMDSSSSLSFWYFTCFPASWICCLKQISFMRDGARLACSATEHPNRQSNQTPQLLYTIINKLPRKFPLDVQHIGQLQNHYVQMWPTFRTKEMHTIC